MQARHWNSYKYGFPFPVYSACNLIKTASKNDKFQKGATAHPP